MIHNIGYPDLVLSDQQLQSEIQGLTYFEEEFFENVLTNLNGRTQREMAMLGQTVNRSIWTTTPAVVNAYYSRNRNQIMFPAGILQPPFYHKFFPKALNFGGIGVVIGHEITHGFDDKGKQFDEQGNINQWWDTSSSTSFRDKVRLISQVTCFFTIFAWPGQNVSLFQGNVHHQPVQSVSCGRGRHCAQWFEHASMASFDDLSGHDLQTLIGSIMFPKRGRT